ncbi:MAG TPA: response regulator [Methylomirabilota bacterium]|nr:response regulator [Methylomirabilota bacterium]
MAKVLIVDDTQVIRDVVIKFLAKDGHEVRSVVNGKQGIELFQKEQFDLVLTDVVMPDISGLEVLAAIRKVNKEIPVIVMSATFNPLKFKETSNTAFVSKTGGINRLIDTIRIYLTPASAQKREAASRGVSFRSIIGRLAEVTGRSQS